MGRPSISSFAFTCLLIVYLGLSPYNALAHLGPLWASPGLGVRIDPAIINVAPGQTFSVNVMAGGATDLGAFQFDILYDPAVVSVTTIELGPFLGSTGRTAQPLEASIDNATGTATFAAFSFGSSAGPEGTGLLAAITLAALGQGASALNLQNVLVTDTMARARPTSASGGRVVVAVPTPTSPPTVAPSPTAPSTPTPTLTNTATPTGTAEPTPADTATATATGEPTRTPTAPPVATETVTPTTAAVPTPTETLAAGKATKAPPPLPVDRETAVPAPATLPPTPTEAPLPQGTATGTASPTPGVIPAWMSTGDLATPTASPVSRPSSVADPDGLLLWLAVGGTIVFIAGYGYVMLRKGRA